MINFFMLYNSEISLSVQADDENVGKVMELSELLETCQFSVFWVSVILMFSVKSLYTYHWPLLNDKDKGDLENSVKVLKSKIGIITQVRR